MTFPAVHHRRLFLPLATIVLLFTLPACGNRVVVGRAEPASKTARPAAKAAAPAPAKVEIKPKPAESPAGGEADKGPVLGAKAAEAAPAPAQEAAPPVPQSSPAPPQDSKSKQEKPAAVSPYKLDLSFGGFGLGIGLLDTPISVALDDQENIYVVDQGNYRVQKFDRFGIFQFAFGKQGMGDGEFVEENVGGTMTLRMTGEFEFNRPVGMFLDTDPKRSLIRITVVDSLNYRIQRFLLTRSSGERFPDDVFVMLPKLGIGPVPDPALKAKYASEGRQVILDPLYIKKGNNVILSPFKWGGLGFTEGLLNNPAYLAMDNNNILYVSDTENGRVQGFYVTPDNPLTDATFYREWGNDLNLPYGSGRLNQPAAVAFDNTGFGGFLVVDKLKEGNYNISRYDKDGRYLNVLSTSGDKEGQFRQPVSIAVNPFDNSVFLTDRARKKVMVYSSSGEFKYEFGGEELSDPRGIAVLRNGYVYVTDAVKNMVYRYIPQ